MTDSSSSVEGSEQRAGVYTDDPTLFEKETGDRGLAKKGMTEGFGEATWISSSKCGLLGEEIGRL
jgi:hypothetical protein